jgi:TatD DNase family protein
MFVDSHAHLTLPEFDNDRRAVIQRAVDAGITQIITIGTDLEDCRKAIILAREYPFIFASVGVHPHDTKTMTAETYGDLKRLAANDRVIAIGEIGLDFYRNHSPREVQNHHFREQLHLAYELSLPVIIHDREAHNETIAMLREAHPGEIEGVIHCFSGDQRTARAFLDMGFYLSIPGTVTFKNAEAYQDMVKELPLDRLLLETDSPFLTPHPFRGRRNEPAHVRYVAKAIAHLRRLDVEEVAQITARNVQTLFKLVP